MVRISPQGGDVDTDSYGDLILHESVFQGQVMQAGYIANPGVPGGTGIVQVPVSLVDLGYRPAVLIWLEAMGLIYSPTLYFSTTGGSTAFGVFTFIMPDELTIVFSEPGIVDGVYYQQLRTPQ